MEGDEVEISGIAESIKQKTLRSEMKVCIPVENNSGLDSPIYGHFGSAPFFIIYDTHNKTIETIENINYSHEHGQCHPIHVFQQREIDIIVVKGIGMRALQQLTALEIKVCKTTREQTVTEILRSYEHNQLGGITLQDTCSHQHGCH
jgi:predicted Fe-Mo cluster-binding NifX family protein